jgi:hypothetical protein
VANSSRIVEIKDGFDQLFEEVSGGFLRELSSFRDEVEELSLISKLHYNEDNIFWLTSILFVIRTFSNAYDIGNILMLQRSHDGHFFLDGIQHNLIDSVRTGFHNFTGILASCVDVFDELYGSSYTATQSFQDFELICNHYLFFKAFVFF